MYVCMYNNDIYTRSCDWRSEILLEIQLYLSSICLIKKKEQDMRAAAGAAKNITQPPCGTQTKPRQCKRHKGESCDTFGAAAVATHPAASA